MHYVNSTKETVLPQGVGKTAPCLGQNGPSPFFAPYISRTHIIAVYVVAYNVEYNFYRNALVEGGIWKK